MLQNSLKESPYGMDCFFLLIHDQKQFSQEEMNKKRLLQMVADVRLSAASASLLTDALSETNKENLANDWKNTLLKISQQMLRPQMVLSNCKFRQVRC